MLLGRAQWFTSAKRPALLMMFRRATLELGDCPTPEDPCVGVSVSDELASDDRHGAGNKEASMSDDRWIPWPWSKGRGDEPIVPWPSSLASVPTTIKDLIGRKCRVVQYGDAVTQEYESGRITIFLNEDGRIADIFFEQDRPIK